MRQRCLAHCCEMLGLTELDSYDAAVSESGFELGECPGQWVFDVELHAARFGGGACRCRQCEPLLGRQPPGPTELVPELRQMCIRDRSCVMQVDVR